MTTQQRALDLTAQITGLMFVIETKHHRGFADISETHRAVERAVTVALESNNVSRLDFYLRLLSRSVVAEVGHE